MHAIILVGGRGTRLQPLTDTRPKPMLPILDLPFLHHQLAHLRRHGVTDVTFACGFLPNAIVGHFGEGEAVGVRLRYVIEPEPLDTAGAIAFAARTLDPQRLLVCNGDVLTDLDVGRLLAVHQQRGARATIALTPVDDPTRYGLVRTDEHGAVTAFVEKPPVEECDTNLINAGTYVLEPDVIAMVPENQRCNIEREVFPELVGRGLGALGADGYWNDIGTFPSYLRANVDMLAGRVAGASDWTSPSHARPRSLVDPAAEVHADAIVEHPVYVGPGAVVEAGARVGPDAVVAAGVRIGAGARVAGSVVLETAQVGAEAQIVGSIVGEGASLAAGSSLTECAVVAPGASETRPVVRGGDG